MKRSTKITLCLIVVFFVLLSSFLTFRIVQLQNEVDKLKSATLIIEYSHSGETDSEIDYNDAFHIKYNKLAASVVAEHYIWYSIFSDQDIDTPEHSIERLSDDVSAIYAEDMTVIYDAASLYTKSASYVFLPNRLQDSEKQSRIYHTLSFFASFEYDYTFGISYEETRTILNDVKVIYQKMMDKVNEELLSVEVNCLVPFYEGKAGTYYFYVTEDNEVLITILVN